MGGMIAQTLPSSTRTAPLVDLGHVHTR